MRDATIRRKKAVSHIPMKGRKRSVRRSLDQPVFDGIDIDVFDVAGKIGFIANTMFPIPPLPEGRFSMFNFGVGHPVGAVIKTGAGQRYRTFDQAPAQGKVRVTRRQGPHTMEMIRQQNPGINCKRMFRADQSRSPPNARPPAPVHRRESAGAGR
jgi:hypothetical protein